MQILALSSSRVGGSGYLEMALPRIREVLGNTPRSIAFIPFAGVGMDHDAYTNKVRESLAPLGHRIEKVTVEDAKAIITQADAIMVGGGNTFQLLHLLYKSRVIDLIRDKVDAGTPYIGWSAGSNILGPTICTTNDMPIVEPESFNALGLLPFQINPHYHDLRIEGFNGETRDERLTEFLILNPGVSIVALPEGCALRHENGKLTYVGIAEGYHFYREEDSLQLQKKAIGVNEDITRLI